MLNRFKQAGSPTAPATVAVPLTPNDTTDLGEYYRALYVGQNGDLACQMNDGTQVTFTAVPAGIVLPVRIKRILSTGTTASNIIGLS